MMENMPEEVRVPKASGPAKSEGSDGINKVSPELADMLDNLKDIDPKQKAELIEVIETAVRQESFSGPIPHPEMLRGYEGVKAGFAERIVSMAEKEQKERFDRERWQAEREKEIIANAAAEAKRGQLFALIISVLFLIGSVVLALFDHDTVAAILGGGTLVSIVTIFITGRKVPSKNEFTHKD